MNQTILKSLLTIICILGSISAKAHTFYVDGIYYNIKGLNVEVTFQGAKYNTYTNEYSGKVIIPESVTNNGTTYSVTTIGANAFRDCSELTEVVIPSTITTIGNYAFLGSKNLRTIRCNVSAPPTISAYTFSDNYSATLYVPIGCESAYNGHKTWKNFKLVNKNIVDGIYYKLKSETDVLVTYKDENYNSYSEDITLPDSIVMDDVKYNVVGIAEKAFYNSSNLKSIYISNSIVSIESEAFSNCTALTSVEIPESITTIGSNAFRNCSSLLSVKWNAINCLDLSEALFEGCNVIESIIFNDEVVHIPAYLCAGLTTLPLIKLPENLSSIGDGAFKECSGLRNITIPNYVMSMGYESFEGCENLKIITVLPEVAPLIKSNTFSTNTYDNTTLVVPQNCLEDYKNAPYWNYFVNIEESTANIKEIESNTLKIGTNNNKLSITGTTDDTIVNIYTTNGTMLHSITANKISNITLPNGIYLVQINGITHKIAL